MWQSFCSFLKKDSLVTKLVLNITMIRYKYIGSVGACMFFFKKNLSHPLFKQSPFFRLIENKFSVHEKKHAKILKHINVKIKPYKITKSQLK